MNYDVVICGAGPAGCLAAAGVKKTNPELSVAIVERSTTKKHRIGEAFLTGTVFTLRDADLLEVLTAKDWHRKRGAAYVWGETSIPWHVNYPLVADHEDYPDFMKDDETRYAVHVPRHEFDAELLKLVCKKYGVDVIEDEILSVHTAGSKHTSITHCSLKLRGKITAKYWIDATGQGITLARHVTERTPIFSGRQAKYAYFKDVNWDKASAQGFDIHRTNIVSSENGWFWVIHLGKPGNDCTSIGFVANSDVIANITTDNFMDFFPDLARFGLSSKSKPLDYLGENQLNELYHHGDYSFKCESIHGSNWALCGDASLFLDPILSQGATLAAHYGFMRGIAAAEWLSGNTDFQLEVTRHYYNEASVLAEMIGHWYTHNRHVSNWKMKAENWSDSKPQGADSFMWITNLENIRKEYEIYPESELIKIKKALSFSE